MSSPNIELVPVADTDALGLGVGRRSIGRRIKNPPENFPRPIRINGRLYFRRVELEAYKQRLIQQALSESAS
jgi:hypothetical protein